MNYVVDINLADINKGDSQSENSTGKTRIQQQNEGKILKAALIMFSTHGFRGATIEQISVEAGMSKPNLLYYFSNKEEVYRRVLGETLRNWRKPLEEINVDGDPITEISDYISKNIRFAFDRPRECRLFASEILRGAPIINNVFHGAIRTTVEATIATFGKWMNEGKIEYHDPKHLLYSIWSTTQYYANCEAKIATLSNTREAPSCVEAENFLIHFFRRSLIKHPEHEQ